MLLFCAAIQNLVNLSLKSDIVPAIFEQALVTPLWKKESLDPNVFKKYTPVSNLTSDRAFQAAQVSKHHSAE